MAFLTPPPSFPLEPPDFSSKAHPEMIQYHQCHSSNLRESLLDLSDKLHGAPQDLAAVGGRANVNSLLLSVVEDSAYGASESIDRVIVRLLHLAVHTCAAEAAVDEAAQTSHRTQRHHHWHEDDDDTRVTWLAPAQFEAREHLELYRNIAAYLASHPASSLYRDPALDATRQTLQRLCPRVNGLCRWTWTEEPVVPPTPTPNGVCGLSWGEESSIPPTLPPTAFEPVTPDKAAAGASRSAKAGKSKKMSSLRSRKVRGPVHLPTPPTQSGDIVGCDEFEETLPTLPVSRPGSGTCKTTRKYTATRFDVR
ncbi:hypothetical protein VTJ49DRAFT_5497 [Mycothermus thermophilus]|uniref:Uncharacterized protein n=1 Tax=Humicola insolens TaxID=85995 RepID=A0ABR3VKK0_HUMIN